MIPDRLPWWVTGPVYDRLARRFDGARRRAVEALDLDAGDRVLVAGCGTGLDFEPLPGSVSALAVDRSPAMVGRARRRAGAVEAAVDVRRGDAASLPLSTDSVDGVLLHLVLSIAADPDAILAEAARVLGPAAGMSVIDAPADFDGRSLEGHLAATGLRWRTLARRDTHRHVLATPDGAGP